MKKTYHYSRRRFLGAAASTAYAFQFLPAHVWGANSRLNVAGIGAGGKGSSDVAGAAKHGANIVALCDVDDKRAGGTYKKFPKAKRYKDFRVMLEKQKDIDAVTVSTPDHVHACAAMAAMKLGKHVYCQKPLTHTIHESRRMVEVAKRKPLLTTQMGTQNASRQHKRQAQQMLSDGIIGEVKEIHAWSDRPAGWWPQGKDRPSGNDPVPGYLKWDLWLGVAPTRPYVSETYAPFKWRGFRNFGCGALGDMACHIADTPIQAFRLYKPTSALVEATDATADMFPSTERVLIEFAGVDASGGKPVTLSWTDGGRKPTPQELGVAEDVELLANCCAIIGTKATMLVDQEKGFLEMWSDGKRMDFKKPNLEGRNHWHQWVDAAFDGDQTQSNFIFAGRMCETLALGALASRFPNQKLKYDTKSMTFPDFPEANQWVRTDYREGWAVKGLSDQT